MVMAQEVIEKYLNELPRELVKAAKPFSNKKELALYVCILKDGPFRFNELKDRFAAHQQEISSALNSLMIAGLIERRGEISSESFAEICYYKASPLGESLMRSMVKGVLFLDSISEDLISKVQCEFKPNKGMNQDKNQFSNSSYLIFPSIKSDVLNSKKESMLSSVSSSNSIKWPKIGVLAQKNETKKPIEEISGKFISPVKKGEAV